MDLKGILGNCEIGKRKGRNFAMFLRSAMRRSVSVSRRFFGYFSGEDPLNLAAFSTPNQRSAAGAARLKEKEAAAKKYQFKKKEMKGEKTKTVATPDLNPSDLHSYTGLAGLAERQMVAAQRAGAFENLPGKGKPLKNLHSGSSDIQTKILANANFVPKSFTLDKEIRKEIDLVRKQLLSDLKRMGKKNFAFSKEEERNRETVRRINRIIEEYNKQVLRDSFEFMSSSAKNFPLMQRAKIDYIALKEAIVKNKFFQ
eukprot:g3097.t1